MIDREGIYFLLRRHDALLQDALREAPPVIEYRNVQRVVLCTDAHAGFICDAIAKLVQRVQVTVVRGASLPRWVGRDDLVIAVSPSGTSPHVLACFRKALNRGSLCAVVTAGGKLLSAARDGGIALSRLSGDVPASFSSPLVFVAILGILRELGISEAYDHLPATIPVDERFCEFVTRGLIGKTPLVLSSAENLHVAQRVAALLNTVARTPAFASTFAHGLDMESSMHHHLTDAYCVLVLHDPAADEHSSERLKRIARSLRERRIPVIDVPLSARDPLFSVLHTDLVALYVAYFLAIRYGVNPSGKG